MIQAWPGRATADGSVMAAPGRDRKERMMAHQAGVLMAHQGRVIGAEAGA